MIYHNLLVCLPINGHFGCFTIGIMNKAVTFQYMHYGHTFLFHLGNYLRVELLSCIVNACLT